ncbi:MAG: hypothetical protein ACJ71Y_20770, partial [Blastococcus sp.]
MAGKATKRTGLPGAVARHPAGIIGGLVGLAAAGTAAGVAVSRIAGRRVRAEQLSDEFSTPTEHTAAEFRADDPLGLDARAADRT